MLPFVDEALFHSTMPASERKSEMIRQQVNAKILWGARDSEVLDWLRDTQGVGGEEAEALLKDAHRARQKAVRAKALTWLIASGLGVLALVAFIVVQVVGKFVVYGIPVLIAYGAGLACIAIFIRSLRRIVSGKTDGAVD
jgi:hypothetical protein